MSETLLLLILLANLLVAVPVTLFCVQVIVALIAPGERSNYPSETLRWPKVAVMIPAHNEDRHLVPTVKDALAQLREGDRLCVVADNCSDGTAEHARAAGAEVVERKNPFALGKSYALEFGIRHLSDDPPDVVIIIDADCRLGENAIQELVRSCCSTGRPAQGCYIILSPDGAGAGSRIAEFAQIVKNRLRPRGYQVLGLPCHLAGSGMALPWEAAQAIDFANGEAVEDLKLGLDLAAAGYPSVFCPSATITSLFPTSAAGASVQRKRWQHGHLRMIVLSVPRLVTGELRCNRNVIALTLDLLVPPLTLLLLIMSLLMGAGGLAAVLQGSLAALAFSTFNMVLVTAAILGAWLSFERRPPTLAAVKAFGRFVAERSLLYPRFIAGGRSVAWVKTVRENEVTPDC